MPKTDKASDVATSMELAVEQGCSWFIRRIHELEATVKDFRFALVDAVVEVLDTEAYGTHGRDILYHYACRRCGAKWSSEEYRDHPWCRVKHKENCPLYKAKG